MSATKPLTEVPAVGDKLFASTVGKLKAYTVLEVTELEQFPRTKANLISNGWDGRCYTLRGVRGAVKLAYRSAVSGRVETI